MQLKEIRDTFSEHFNNAGWHFLEGDLQDIDRYKDIKEDKALFRWGTTQGEWIKPSANHEIFLLCCVQHYLHEKSDIHKNLSYLTDKYQEVVDRILAVYDTLMIPEVTGIEPKGNYRFQAFPDRFKERLFVVESRITINTDFYCSPNV